MLAALGDTMLNVQEFVLLAPPARYRAPSSHLS